MKKEITITIFHDSNSAAWADLVKFSQIWNEDHESKLENVMDIHFTIGFDKDKPEYAAFMEWLNDTALHQIIEAESHEFITYQESDFQKADFIHLSGISAPDGFIVNEKAAFGDVEECKTCGSRDPWAVPQLGPLIIDDNQLLAADFLNLANGGLLLSKKVIDLFYKDHGKDIFLIETLHKNGIASENYFEVRAAKAILLPDLKRTLLKGSICPTCGVVHGQFESELFFAKQDIKNADAFSMHPNHYAMIFFKKEIVNILKQNNIHGFSMDLPAYIS